MILPILLILIFLNAVSLLEAAFILANFQNAVAISMASIEIFMIAIGFLVILGAIVIQIATDTKYEIHIPEMNNCIALSAVVFHIVGHILPAIAAIRYAWYADTLPSQDEFLLLLGAIIGIAGLTVLGTTLAIYAILEIHSIQKLLDTMVNEVRGKLNMKKKATV